MIRVVLADDQALVRAGFRSLLDAEPDIEVVGEAADGAQAVASPARSPPRRRAHGHPDARGRRPRRHRDRSPPTRARRGPGRHAHDVRARRVRLRGAPGRRQRLPGEGHRARRTAACRPGGRRRRRAAVAQRDPPADRASSRPRPAAPTPPRRRWPSSPTASGRSSRWSAQGLTNDEIAARLVRQPGHRQDPREPRDGQARRPRPRAARRVRLRVGLVRPSWLT